MPLNLGILAHVDAGKTTLTERLLYAAGVITEIGRVDDGTTRTDSLELERRRGITIRSAVVSFPVGDTAVNVVDTPGHPDFIAEVDRALGVLDGAVLVVSAVEGVQAQTRVLMRALRRLDVPTLLFVNKVDRRGADVDRVVAEIGRRLRVPAVPLCRVLQVGSRDAAVVPLADEAFAEASVDALAAQDDALLAAYVSDGGVLAGRLRAALVDGSRRGRVHPVLAGSAATGAGIDTLMTALVDLLPVAAGDDAAPASGSVFAIERDPRGEKVAYARMFDGTLRTRDRPGQDPGHPGDKIAAIEVVAGGSWVRRDVVRAGEIGRLWGLVHVRVGDPLGRPRAAVRRQFAPPGLEAVVEPVRPQDHVALRTALARLAEQDPLIDVRDGPSELAVSLYGEVQKEVLAATLAADHGVEVVFREATPVCIERPAGVGEAVEVLNTAANPFHATVGLRVEPGPTGSGIAVRLAVDHRDVPLHVYGRYGEFATALERYVRQTLSEGRYGWPVADCLVTMTDCGYSVADGPPSLRGPSSTAADFRKLTPIVVMAALDRAGVTVCAPVSRVRVDAPFDALGPLLAALSRLGAEVGQPSGQGDEVTVRAVLPTTDVRHVQRMVPDLTGGEGVVEAEPAGYRPVRGAPPTRPRTAVDPLHRPEYLAALAGR